MYYQNHDNACVHYLHATTLLQLAMPELGTYLATEKDGARGADQRGSTRKSPDNPDEHSKY